MQRHPGAADLEHISPAEAFSILASETRIDILQALWEAGEPRSFAELRRDVTPDDSGNFNYHLGKLTDYFVQKTDEGYVLRFAGEQVMRAVLAGTFSVAHSLPAAEIAERCTYCGSPVEMSYEDECIIVRCTDCGGVVQGDTLSTGTFMEHGFPPSGLAGRTREEVVDAAHVLYDSKITPMMNGVCPECAGRTTVSVEVCPDHRPAENGLCPACDTRYEVWSYYECEYCGYGRRTAMWFAALNHTAVIAFYQDHGLDETVPFRKLTSDNARFVRDITERVVTTDPYRFQVSITVDGETITVDLDDELEILTVERDGR